jgi:hypothetical protein
MSQSVEKSVTLWVVPLDRLFRLFVLTYKSNVVANLKASDGKDV